MLRIFQTLVILAILAGCTGAPPSQDCADKAIFCVGVVTESGKINSPGLNNDTWQAILNSRQNGTIDKAEYIETVADQDFAANVQFFVREGYDLVVTVGYGLTKTTVAAAQENPQVLFIGIDQSNDDELPNFAGLTFAADQAGYMAGTLAALVSKTKIVGAACESEYVTPMRLYCEGFRYGVSDTDPEIQVEIRYRPDDNSYLLFQDTAWGEAIAQELGKAGADVIFSAGGRTALSVAQTAAQDGLLVIGGGEDFSTALPEISGYLLTSLVKKISPSLDELLAQAVNGSFSTLNVTGAYTVAPFGTDLEPLTPEVIAKLREVETGLVNGEIFTGIAPEPDNNGE